MWIYANVDIYTNVDICTCANLQIFKCTKCANVDICKCAHVRYFWPRICFRCVHKDFHKVHIYVFVLFGSISHWLKGKVGLSVCLAVTQAFTSRAHGLGSVHF